MNKPYSFKLVNLPALFDDICSIQNSIQESFLADYNYTTPQWTGGYSSVGSVTSFPFTLETLETVYTKLPGVEVQNSKTAFEQAKKIYRDGLPSFPAADIFLDNVKNTLNFALALPGYDQEDIKISFDDDYMIVDVRKDNAIKKDKKDEKENRLYLRQGLANGSVQFKVPVPVARFDVKEASAEYENGMLQICIPRLKECEPHAITITPKSKK